MRGFGGWYVSVGIERGDSGMRWSQTLLICAVIMLSASAVIGVQFYALNRYEQKLDAVARTKFDAAGGFAEFMASEDAPALPKLDVEDFSLGIGAPLESAEPTDVAVIAPLPTTAPAKTAGEPDVLPETAAAPLPNSDDVLRQIVTEELPGASSTEQEVWAEELAGLPPFVVRELLRVRQEFNAPATH